MEKYSKYRDLPTGVAPFLVPLPPSTAAVPLLLRALGPLAWLAASIRTTLVLLLLLVQFFLVEVLLKICLVVPPVHDWITRIVTSVLVRFSLLVLGFAWIPVEEVSLRRTARSPVPAPFTPTSGDVIIANSSSYIDVLYLAFRYNPTFLLAVSSKGSQISVDSPAKITSWRRVTLLTAFFSSGSLPERSERGETLAEASKAARGAVVVFPECTTSNNRALLKPASLPDSRHLAATPLRTFILAFRYEPPTQLSPSATIPIPSAVLSPLPHLFSLTTSPLPRHLTVRRLHPTESPKMGASPRGAEWEAVFDALAATGRLKRTGLGWESKAAFLEFRAGRKK